MHTIRSGPVLAYLGKHSLREFQVSQFPVAPISFSCPLALRRALTHPKRTTGRLVMTPDSLYSHATATSRFCGSYHSFCPHQDSPVHTSSIHMGTTLPAKVLPRFLPDYIYSYASLGLCLPFSKVPPLWLTSMPPWRSCTIVYPCGILTHDSLNHMDL
jgi:hypothetical protein